LRRGRKGNVEEIIVVEGKNDTIQIKKAVNAHTIETNGSAIDEQTLTLITHAQKKRGVIIFTDPDYAGMRIRRIIDEAVPHCKHAFLNKRDAKSLRNRDESLGIEHASVEAIRHALSQVYERYDEREDTISREDLIYFKLIGHPHSKRHREKLGELLHIGYTNGKQLLKRLNMFHITIHELDKAMLHILKNEERQSKNE